MIAIYCLFLLQLKHYIVDFRLQTQAQIKTKGTYGNLVGLGHTLGTMLVLLPFLWNHPVVLILCSIFDTLIHYHCDFVKMQYGIKEIAQPKFWWQLGQDQLVHQLTYLAIASAVVHFA